MTVKQFMNSKIVTVSTDTLLPKVWKLLSSKHISGIPVVDKDHKLVGYISKEDILVKLFPDDEDLKNRFDDSDEQIEVKLEKLKKLTASKVMSKRVIFTRVDTLVMRALSRMMVQKVRQLPVLDEDDLVVGMISKADIFKGLFRRK